MIICNKVFGASYSLNVNNIIEGQQQIVTNRIKVIINSDVWIITNKRNKYLGTIFLYLPKEKGEPIGILFNMEDNHLIADTFHCIRKEYPNIDFCTQICSCYENELKPYIVEEAGFILKSRNNGYTEFYYVNVQ